MSWLFLAYGAGIDFEDYREVDGSLAMEELT